MVYAAQPREGTETRATGHDLAHFFMVYAAQPREGTETTCTPSLWVKVTAAVYAAQPREGTETEQST